MSQKVTFPGQWLFILGENLQERSVITVILLSLKVFELYEQASFHISDTDCKNQYIPLTSSFATSAGLQSFLFSLNRKSI